MDNASALTKRQITANLKMAVINNDITEINASIKAGADIDSNYYDDDYLYFNGISPLWIAASSGFIEALEILIKAGAKVNTFNDDERSLIVETVTGISHDYRTKYEHGSLLALQMLIDAGVDVNMTDKNDWSALMHAAKFGHLDMVKVLKKAGSNVNHSDENRNKTALHLAAINGHINAIHLLLELGADQSIIDTDFRTAEDVGSDEAQAFFASRRARATMQNILDATNTGLLNDCLYKATYNNDIEEISRALIDGAQIDSLCCDSKLGGKFEGRCSVSIAAIMGNAEALKVLIEYLESRGDIDEIFLFNNAITSCEGNKQTNVLATVRNLIDAGLDVENSNALYTAAEVGDVQLIKFLVEEVGMNINSQDDRDFTPLHYAAIEGHISAIHLLLELGADHSVINEDGETAEDVAGSEEAIDYFVSLWARTALPAILAASKLTQGPK